MARAECRPLERNFQALRSAGWSATCGSSRIKNRLINTRPGLASFEWIITGITSASLLILFADILCLVHSQSVAPSVIKVEPPSWWSSHAINPVRLLIRGKNLIGVRVKAERPQTPASDVGVNRNGSLFVNVCTVQPQNRVITS